MLVATRIGSIVAGIETRNNGDLTMRQWIGFLLLLLVLPAWTVVGQEAVAPPFLAELAGVRKLADDAPHSAFTDLLYWNNPFVCAFRQGRSHVSSDGRIAVLTSPDGDKWDRAATLTLAGFDLRDASLSTTPDGRLMLIGGAAPRKTDHEPAPTGTFVSFSADATTWTEPKVIIPPGRWLWRVTWHDGKAYGVSYATPEGAPHASLLTSEDGVHFTELVPQLFSEGHPTEAVLRFAADGAAYCLQRRDGAAGTNSAYLGVSQPPYTNWEWRDLGQFFGGPNLLQLPDGTWIAAGRIHYPGGAKTDVAWLDPQTNRLQSLLTLPSGGDTSYPGLVYRDGLLWVSYYSSHEGKTAIYLAKVKLNKRQE